MADTGVAPGARVSERAVVVAGGNGTRLQPLTAVLPKVLMPLGRATVLDYIVGQLHRAGVRDIHLLLGHHADLVRAYTESRFPSAGITIHTGTGEQGTAGPLRVLNEDDGNWLVVNGDVVADIDLRSVLYAHCAHAADLTIVGAAHRTAVPYGVLRHDGEGNLESVDEKPCIDHLVNAGIYVLGPRARQLVPAAGRCDMTDVISLCATARLRVRVFELVYSWFDIGTLDSYEALLRSELAATVTEQAGSLDASRPRPAQLAELPSAETVLAEDLR
jgi:NDP-sugar pyrophosphorylase family protein